MDDILSGLDPNSFFTFEHTDPHDLLKNEFDDELSHACYACDLGNVIELIKKNNNQQYWFKYSYDFAMDWNHVILADCLRNYIHTKNKNNGK